MSVLSAKLSRWSRDGGLGAQIARGASGSFLVKTAGTGLVLLLQVFLARLLGTEQYGIYIYALNWINTCLLAAVWGWDAASIRLVSAYCAQARWSLLRGLLATGRKVVAATSLLVAGAIAAVVWVLKDRMGSDLATVFWIGCLILPINAQVRQAGASLRGFKRVVRAQIPQAVLRPVILAVAAAIAFPLIGTSATAIGAMLLNGLAAAIVLAISWHWLGQAQPVEARAVERQSKSGEWARIALPLLLVSGFQVLMQRVDVLMLGALIGPTEAGIYSVAGRIAQLAGFGLVAVNAILAPVIADFYARGKLAEMQEVLSRATLAIAAVTLFLAAGIAFLGDTLLGMFGADFVAGRMALLILVAAYAVNGLAGPVVFLLTMTGHHGIAARILAYGVLMNAGLNFVLIPIYGIEGAAAATALSLVAWRLMMIIHVKRRLRISPTVLSILNREG